MQFEDSALARAGGSPNLRLGPHIGRRALISALVCAGLCIALMRAGFLSFFFLVPLGLCSAVYGPAAAWLAFIVAASGNGALSLGLSLYLGMGLESTGLNILYFFVMSLGFTWIMAGDATPVLPPVRTVFRFITASVAGALAFWGMIFSLNEGFSALFHSQIEAISSAYIASLGADAARQAVMERLLTPDSIIEAFSMIFLRGGAVVSVCFLFFFSRQAVFILARLFRKRAGARPIRANDLVGFCAPRKTIWVLSLCLPVILLCRAAASLRPVEITAWNILVICAIMFLAQGGGVVLFNLSRKPLPFIVRLLCVALFIFLMLSPGINVLAIGFLALLGLAETWLPLRKSEQGTDNS